MSVSTQFSGEPSPLSGSQGVLVSVHITVQPRMLEDLLDSLAGLPFPVNPEIHHHIGDRPDVAVAFPAYDGQLESVRACLARAGFSADVLAVRSMLDELTH